MLNESIKNKPRVSIGMPVYNGEKFIEKAIDSILNQTYTDFELIICDNASSDQTREICQKFAMKDDRIRYYRNSVNIGGPNNYNRTFELGCNNEYFKWAAYDDVLAPDFLKQCITFLDSNPSFVGCFCKTGRINEDGTFLGYHRQLIRTCSNKPHERFRELLDMYYITTPFHGVYRTKFFAKSQRHGTYIGADRNLVAELSLMGRIYELPECLFFWREHSSSYTSMFYGRVRDNTLDRLIRENMWWSSEKASYFPHWKNMIEYFRSVNRISLTTFGRILCYGQIFDWVLRQGRRFLTKDILLFLWQHSRIGRLFIPKSLKILALMNKIFYFIEIEW